MSITNTANQFVSEYLAIQKDDFYSVPVKASTSAIVNTALVTIGAVESTVDAVITGLATPLLLIDNSFSKGYLPESLVNFAGGTWSVLTNATLTSGKATLAAFKGIFSIYPETKAEIREKELLEEIKYLKADLEDANKQLNKKALIIRDLDAKLQSHTWSKIFGAEANPSVAPKQDLPAQGPKPVTREEKLLEEIKYLKADIQDANKHLNQKAMIIRDLDAKLQGHLWNKVFG